MDERNKELSDRLQELELKQERSPVGNAGPRENKSDERADRATEAGGHEITPPEQQSRREASSSYGLSPFTNWSSRGSNHRRHRPNHRRRCHTIIHSPSLPQNLFWLTDSAHLFLPRLENRHTDPSRLLELEV